MACDPGEIKSHVIQLLIIQNNAPATIPKKLPIYQSLTHDVI